MYYKTRDEITEKLGGGSENRGTGTIILQSYSNLRGLYMAESIAPKRIVFLLLCFFLFFFFIRKNKNRNIQTEKHTNKQRKNVK